MAHNTNRREFLTTTAAAGLGLLCTAQLHASVATAQPVRKKSLIGRPNPATLEKFKAGGFDGIEANVWNITPEEAGTYRRAADALDMRIHSVLRGWTNFNDANASKVQAESHRSRKHSIRPRSTVPTRCCWSPASCGPKWRFPNPKTSKSKSTTKQAMSLAS